MANETPQTYEEAQKLFNDAKVELMNSDQGEPAEEPDESKYLNDLDKKLATVDRLPKNSQEAIDMYSGEPQADGGGEYEAVEGEDPYGEPIEYETSEEDRDFYKSFEKSISSEQDSRMAAHLARLEQENQYLRQLDQQRQQLVKESEEKAWQTELELDIQKEKDLLYGLHEAGVDGDETARTRLTNALTDHKVSMHTKAMMRALLQNGYTVPGAQQQPSVPTPQYQAPPQPQYANVGGYAAAVTPHQVPAPNNIPPPKVSNAAPGRSQRRVAAPTGANQTRRGEPKLDRDEMMIIQSMPWKGQDGKPMSFEDKKKLYIASNYRR